MAHSNQREAPPVEPLARLMKREMADQRLTFRALSQRTEAIGSKLTHAYLNGIARGEERPSVQAISTIARALGVKPERIMEYQLAAARRLFDERDPTVGLEEAWARFMEFQPAFEKAIPELVDEVLPPSGDGSRDAKARRPPRRRGAA